jgi:hypothetical protein
MGRRPKITHPRFCMENCFTWSFLHNKEVLSVEAEGSCYGQVWQLFGAKKSLRKRLHA